MPEFHIDANEPAADGRRYSGLDAFTRGYIEAAFFTSTGTGDDAESGLEHASFADIAPSALDGIVADCAKWQADNAELLALAADRDGYDMERAGNDYWYTRNGHGVGFWDRKELDAEGLGDKLSAACRYRSVDMYRGDDGLIYFN